MFIKNKCLSKFFILIVIVLLTVSEGEARNRQDTACLTFDTLIVDVGDIYMDAPKQVYYVGYTNSGKRDLNIINIGTDCDCTQVTMPECPLSYGCRATLEIHLDMSRFTFPGLFEKEIYIVSDSSDKPVTLKIKGRLMNAVNKKEDDK